MLVCVIDAVIISKTLVPHRTLSFMVPLFGFITPLIVGDIGFVRDLIKGSPLIFGHYGLLFLAFGFFLRQLRFANRHGREPLSD